MSEMGDAPTAQEIDRAEAMLFLFARGYTFAAMVPVLVKFELLDCQESHRFRTNADGTRICVTCENTVAVSWKRQMHRIGATKEELHEVRGAWLTTHRTVEEICIARFSSDIVTTETRTEEIDGKMVTTTTERREPRTNVALLRLWCEVRDKMARMGGLNVKSPASTRQIPRRMLRVGKRDPNDTDERGDGIAN